MQAAILSLILAAPLGQSTLPARARLAQDTLPEAKAAKSCPCSPACECGCNEGKPCRCGEPVEARPAPASYRPAPAYYRAEPAVRFAPAPYYPAPAFHLPAYRPAYSAPAFQPARAAFGAVRGGDC